MKYILLFFGLIFTLSYSLSAQSPIMTASDLISDYSGQIRNSVDKKDLSIEGNPYIYEKFLPGLVYPKNDDRVFKVNLNVNAYSNLFELKYDDRVYEMPNYAFDSVKIGQNTFIPVSVFDNDLVTFYSMEVLASDNEGNFLVSQYVVHLQEATMAKAYHMASPAKYQSFPGNYFIYDSEERVLYPLRQVKNLSKNLDTQEDLKSFLKENKIRKRDTADLQKLFYFLYPGT